MAGERCVTFIVTLYGRCVYLMVLKRAVFLTLYIYIYMYISNYYQRSTDWVAKYTDTAHRTHPVPFPGIHYGMFGD